MDHEYLTFTLPKELAQELWRMAAEEEIPMDQLTGRLLHEILENRSRIEDARRNIVKFP